MHIFSQILLARLFGPAGFGLYSIGWNILRTVGIVAPLGLDNGVIRFGAQTDSTAPEDVRDVMRVSINTSLLSGAFFGLVFFLFSPWLSQLISKPDLTPILRWFSLAFPLASGLKVTAAATRLTKRMRFGILAEEVAQPVSNLLLIFLFYMFGWGVLGASTAGTISFFVGLLIALGLVRNLFFKGVAYFHKGAQIWRQLLSYSLPTAIASMSASLMLLVDRLLVGIFLTEADAGIYQAVSLSSVLFVTVLNAFKTIVAPIAADLHQKENPAELAKLARVSTRWGLYVSLPMLLLIWIAPREIISVLFGASYEIGYTTLVVLSIAQLINVATGAVDIFLIMTEHQKDWMLISTGMFIANLTLNILLIPTFGIIGAAAATAVTYSGISILALVRVRQALGFWPYNAIYWKGLAAAAIAAIALLGFSKIQLAPSLLSLTIKSLGAAGVFALMLFLLGLDADDLALLSLFRKLPPDVSSTR